MHRLPRIRLRVALIATVAGFVAGAAFLWLRDSALVRVARVEVVGLSSSEGDAVRKALNDAAARMTTLRVREEALREAVRPFTSVADLRVSTDFPHGLHVEVTEREPVAEVAFAGERVPVGAGGRLMRGVEPSRALPVLHATRLAPGGRLTDERALEAVGALAAAPASLRRRVSRVWTGPKGLTLDLRSGPQLFFGAAARLDAKWLATARVLAEPSAAGAVYLDVRVPERVAAGGLGTVPSEDPDALVPNPQAVNPNPQLQPEEPATLDP